MRPKIIKDGDQEYTVAQVAKILDVSIYAIHKRLKRGWTMQDMARGRRVMSKRRRAWEQAELERQRAAEKLDI